MTPLAVTLSIVVPVLNERSILPAVFSRLERMGSWDAGLEIILSDAGSRDGSAELVAEWAERHSVKYVLSCLSAPSVGRTVLAGLKRATADAVLVLPCDSEFGESSLSALRSALAAGATCGGFEKTYKPSNRLLSIYARLQNRLRLRVFRNVVWTNGIFFRRSLVDWREFPVDGFLEDVLLSDRLRKNRGWTALSPPILISSRRYYPGRVGTRIVICFVILLLYRAGLAGPTRLRRLYYHFGRAS